MINAEKRILLVEDEDEIRDLILLYLQREGHLVDAVADGEQAATKLDGNDYHLVILDWMLPGMSGLDLTRYVRSNPSFDKRPILFVTAKVEPEDVAEGLNAGADDYLTKPFDTLVLMARVNALLRRQDWLAEQNGKTTSVIKVGPLVMDTDTFDVHLDDEKMDLTRSEFRLLQSLMENQGKVLSRESLIGVIQGDGVNVVGRTVDTHVFGLRKKLGQRSDLIETIRGIGYRVRYLGQ